MYRDDADAYDGTAVQDAVRVSLKKLLLPDHPSDAGSWLSLAGSAGTCGKQSDCAAGYLCFYSCCTSARESLILLI